VQYEDSDDESEDCEGEKEGGEIEKELAFYTNIQGQLRMMLDNFFE
jgi:hypothetical protein